MPLRFVSYERDVCNLHCYVDFGDTQASTIYRIQRVTGA